MFYCIGGFIMSFVNNSIYIIIELVSIVSNVVCSN